MSVDNRKAIWSWSLYDWANSAFSTTVMAGFFPVFFKQYWSIGVDPTLSTARLGLANSLAGILVALMAPLLGAIADQGSARKKFLAFFAFLGVVMTMALFFVSKGNWVFAVGFFVIATIGFSGANIFYDSLLPSVASKKKMDSVSTLGYALGYIGGGLLFSINVAMTIKPAWFGLVDPSAAVRVSFFTVALWWALFSIPLFLYVQELKSPAPSTQSPVLLRGFQQLMQTFHELRKLKIILLFLLAYWFYIDGVYTMIRMAVDYGMSIGLASKDLILALLLTQFVGFPSALAFGKLANRISAKKVILIGIVVYLGVSVWGAMMKSSYEFYLLAATIGLVQGGIQALSRSYYAKLIPANKSAEYFGFFNMIGKFAAIIGPVLIGSVGLFLRSIGTESMLASRLGISSISILFIIGGILLLRVKTPVQDS
jgi:MFS transporter, UMF1 family